MEAMCSSCIAYKYLCVTSHDLQPVSTAVVYLCLKDVFWWTWLFWSIDQISFHSAESDT